MIIIRLSRSNKLLVIILSLCIYCVNMAIYLIERTRIHAMKIFIKQHTGRTIGLDVEPDILVIDLARMAYEKRSEARQEATIENYLRSIKLTHAYKNLSHQQKHCDLGVANGSTITEIAMPFTMSPNFDWETLSVADPISLTDTDEPYMLNPGCAHTFGKSELKLWVKTKIEEHQKPNCPTCRTDIPMSHLLKIMLFAPPTSSQGTGSTTDDLTGAPSAQ